MNYYFITGSSKGLGKALVDLLLKNESNFIYGLSRTRSVKHERFVHAAIDLSKLDEVLSFQFPTLADVDKIVLM